MHAAAERATRVRCGKRTQQTAAAVRATPVRCAIRTWHVAGAATAAWRARPTCSQGQARDPAHADRPAYRTRHPTAAQRPVRPAAQ